MNPVLHADNLNIRFGGVIGADDVSVTLSEGEVVSAIGANGAGKTTFINMVTGYLKPQTGTIRYLGQDITPLSPRQITRIGIRRSFQVPQLFPEMTALDNLLVGLSLSPSARVNFRRPYRTAETEQAALEVLERYAIADYAGQEVAMLPQGVRKILDIAMATVDGPKLVFLDEPTSGVSADEKFPIMDTLMAALKALGVTVLFVEHDMDVVERYAHRVVAFYNGRVIADGPVEGTLTDPHVRKYVVGKQLHRNVQPQGGG